MTSFSQQVLQSLQRLMKRSKMIRSLFLTFLLSLRPGSWGMAKPSDAIRFVEEVEALFSSTLSDEKLLKLSEGFKKQYTEALAHNPACMLPSFNYALPTGKEEGTFIALDVGGSTFRVAALRLFVPEGQERGESEWLAITSFKIDDEVKSFDGEKFFAWLAEKIAETLEKYHIAPKEGEKFAMGLAWSFPIEHTGLRSGKIQGMGKGFKASESLLGTCLADTVQAACDTLNLPLTMTATVNDGTATLLSRAYSVANTHYGLILGTGVNASVHIPTSLSQSKLAGRTETGSHVITNCELSMFGGGLLPMTRWDEQLKSIHPLPDFQPLEMLVSGRYLGEITRLVYVEAIEKHGFLNGYVPSVWAKPYSLDTEVMADVHVAKPLSSIKDVLSTRYPSESWDLTSQDLEVLQRVARVVAKRASALVAASVYSLYAVREESTVGAGSKANVACAGSIIQHYPDFYKDTQDMLRKLSKLNGQPEDSIELVIAVESSLLGAAVASAEVACAARNKESQV